MIPNVLADDTVEPLAKTILALTLRILPLVQYLSRETGLFDAPW
jgi:hypothetical protein